MNNVNELNVGRDDRLFEDDVNVALSHLPEQKFDRLEIQSLANICSKMVSDLDPVKTIEHPKFAEFRGNPLAVALGFYYQTGNAKAAGQVQRVLDGWRGVKCHFEMLVAAPLVMVELT